MDSKQYNQLGSIGDFVAKLAERATDREFDLATTWANEYIEGRVSLSNILLFSKKMKLAQKERH